MYDIIGDIHGYATPLRNLLTLMGYHNINGVWQHPQRKAVFLGDFVDRGPEQVETVLLVRAMVENGHAYTIMGNHEFNAVAWATPHPQQPHTYLRPHTPKNQRQHQSFLDQVVEGSELHEEIVKWFANLPLYLEFEGFRVIHACWHAPSLQTLAPYLNDQARIKPKAWEALTNKDTPAYQAAETILKGLEIALPSGHEFFDKDGNARQHIRTQWWKSEYLTYRDLAEVPPDVLEKIPHDPIPTDLMPGYYPDKLLFVGHYWRTGTPAPLSDNIACLDYSIAAKNQSGPQDKGKLCAYCWNGEDVLTQDGFVWVS